MFSRIIATTLLSLVLLTHLLVPGHADTDIFLAGTSMNCDSLIESDPRAFVYMNRLVFTANSDVISFPREIREIYFGGDAVIDRPGGPPLCGGEHRF